MDNKNKVPDILTVKDLDYLKDIFGWNYILYKYSTNSLDCLVDNEIIKLFKEVSNFSYDNLNLITDILAKEENNE